MHLRYRYSFFYALVLTALVWIPRIEAQEAMPGALTRLASTLLERYREKSPKTEEVTLAVLPFNATKRMARQGAGVAAADMLIQSFVDAPEFRVVERNELNRVLHEQRLQRSGAIDSKTAVRLGKMLGARLLVLGNIARVDDRHHVSARIVDVQDGSILATGFEELAATTIQDAAAKINFRVRDNLQPGGFQFRMDGGVFFAHDISNFTGGFGVRTPSERYELRFDFWKFDQDGTFSGQHENTPDTLNSTLAMKVLAFHLIPIVRFPYRRVNVPGIMRLNGTGALHAGVGIGLYRVRQTHSSRLATFNGGAFLPFVPYSDGDRTLTLPLPVFEVGMTHKLNNALEVTGRLRYVNESAQGIGTLKYGGMFSSFSLGYRLF